MIICPRKKFIFIKNLKVASTSMEIWLSQLCGEDAVITRIASDDEEIRRKLGYRGPQNCRIPWRRYSVRDWGRLLIKRRAPPSFENHDSILRVKRYCNGCADYFSFCFERNPWDKVVSLYYYALYQRNADPEDYSITDLLNASAHRISNWDRYTNEADEIIVDHVARFENLEDELETICRRIGVARSCMGPLPRVKAGYRHSKKSYRELLTTGERDRIGELCHKEIAYFGYAF